MSAFWKKLKGNGSKPDQPFLKNSQDSRFSAFKEKARYSLLICPADEKPYLTVPDVKTDDPLLAKSQIIKSFEVLLRECSGLPYFLEYLQVCEVDHYAECWIECDKFRALALSLLKKYRDKEDTKNLQSGPCTTSNQCRNSKWKNSRNSSTQNQNEEEKSNLVNILPDLVSNIPNNVSVTPLPSPENPVSVTLNNNEKPNFKNTDANETSETNTCDNLKSENDYNENFEILKPQTEVNVNCNTPFESLKQRLLGFASQIYDKFIGVNSTKSVELPETIRGVVLDTLMSHDIDCNIFAPVQEFLYTFLEKEYFRKYLQSEYFLKHTVEVFTGQKVILQDILSCDSAIPYFMEFLEQEEGQPLLEFWISAFNFKEHLEKQRESESYDANEAQSDAMVLYDKYFSLQATHKLGFSDQVRFLVECNICQENGPSPRCFDVPLRIVLSVIQRDFLCGYISSSLHIKFVSELINTMRITNAGRKKRSASGSTCMSDESNSTTKSSGRTATSISQTNTLLAMDSSSNIFGSGTSSKLFKNLDDPSLAMRIDSIQILDPDSLWRRKNFTKLSCGYVDELGRFESDLQPEPDRKNESKLSKTLRRFVKIEENKVKEDMAYKVAEMIIKDVTNVTLGERDRPKRQGRPMSCTQEQLGAFSTSSTSQLQRSSSEIFNYGLSRSFNVPSGS